MSNINYISFFDIHLQANLIFLHAFSSLEKLFINIKYNNNLIHWNDVKNEQTLLNLR